MLLCVYFQVREILRTNMFPHDMSASSLEEVERSILVLFVVDDTIQKLRPRKVPPSVRTEVSEQIKGLCDDDDLVTVVSYFEKQKRCLVLIVILVYLSAFCSIEIKESTKQIRLKSEQFIHSFV